MLLEEGEIVGTEKYRDRLIRVALLKALSFFPTFRPDVVLTYTSDDVMIDGKACVAFLPAGAKIREAKIIPSQWGTEEEMAGYDHEDRLGPLEEIDWDMGQRLINGLTRTCDLLYAISPDRNHILVSPIISLEKQLVVTIESLGRKFLDPDVLNIPEVMEDRFVVACADYARAHVSKDIDRNPSMFETNFSEFKRELQSIYKEIPR